MLNRIADLIINFALLGLIARLTEGVSRIRGSFRFSDRYAFCIFCRRFRLSEAMGEAAGVARGIEIIFASVIAYLVRNFL